jgi:hypothetical protein
MAQLSIPCNVVHFRTNKHVETLCLFTVWHHVPFPTCLSNVHYACSAGVTFKYSERMVAKNWPLALAASVGLLAVGIIIKLVSIFPFLRKWLPMPGSGPSRETMENGYIVVSGAAVGVNVSPQEPPKAYSIFKVRVPNN